MSKEERPKEENLNVTERELKFEQLMTKLSNSISQLVITQEKPNKSVEIIGAVGSTTSKKIQEIFEIKNPFKETALIKEVDLIPDTDFRTLSILKISANRSNFFNSKSVGYFANIGTNNIIIPKGLPIERDESVKFFFNNNDDSTPVSLSANVMFTI